MRSIFPPSLAAVLVCLVTAAGCATSSSREAPAIKGTVSGNYLAVEGIPTTIQGLPHTLRSMGADLDTRIELTVTPQTSAETLSAIARSLSARHYTKFVFLRPRPSQSKAATPRNGGRF